ncbi:MAG: copper chaperone PCu(A)C [Sphingomonas bacterium]|nr:copper chaperone PCu(A)C [Sphingomonas bacterium]
MNPMLCALAPLFLIAACSSPTKDEAIEVRDAWARATAPGQPSGAIYATLVNHGAADDALIGAAAPSAAMAMIHTSSLVDGVARMRMVDRLAIPAGATIALAPGGTHVMLDGLGAPLVAGEQTSITLRFATAGAKQVPVAIVAPGAR